MSSRPVCIFTLNQEGRHRQRETGFSSYSHEPSCCLSHQPSSGKHDAIGNDTNNRVNWELFPEREYGTRGCRIRVKGRVSPWTRVERGLGCSPSKQFSGSPSLEPPPSSSLFGVRFICSSCLWDPVSLRKAGENLDLSPTLLCCEATAQPSFLSQHGARLPAQDGR